jgi:hypothetical protein
MAVFSSVPARSLLIKSGRGVRGSSGNGLESARLRAAAHARRVSTPYFSVISLCVHRMMPSGTEPPSTPASPPGCCEHLLPRMPIRLCLQFSRRPYSAVAGFTASSGQSGLHPEQRARFRVAAADASINLLSAQLLRLLPEPQHQAAAHPPVHRRPPRAAAMDQRRAGPGAHRHLTGAVTCGRPRWPMQACSLLDFVTQLTGDTRSTMS